jgi:uncharacterized protein YdaU (DUF1376 family)
MSDTPWVKFYPSDWLAGTGDLTAAERGVYITIVCLIYEYGGPVPLDRTRLARRCGVPAGSFKRILEGLLDCKKLIETPEGLTNERAERVLGERENVTTKRQSGARKTNAIRAEKKQQNQRNDERSPLRSSNAIPEARSQKPDIEKETPNGVSKKTSGTRLPEDWVLPREWGEWAVSQGWAVAAIREEAERFRDYWISKSGRDATKVDWLATWRNWMRGSKSPKAMNGGRNVQNPDGAAVPNRPQNRPDPALEQIARLTGIGAAQSDAGGGIGGDGEEDGPLWVGSGQRVDGARPHDDGLDGRASGFPAAGGQACLFVVGS